MPQFILVENGVQTSTARLGNAIQCPSLPFGSLTTVSCFRTWPCKALLARSTIDFCCQRKCGTAIKQSFPSICGRLTL